MGFAHDSLKDEKSDFNEMNEMNLDFKFLRILRILCHFLLYEKSALNFVILNERLYVYVLYYISRFNIKF